MPKSKPEKPWKDCPLTADWEDLPKLNQAAATFLSRHLDLGLHPADPNLLKLAAIDGYLRGTTVHHQRDDEHVHLMMITLMIYSGCFVCKEHNTCTVYPFCSWMPMMLVEAETFEDQLHAVEWWRKTLNWINENG